jgi:hypothetical protein
VANRFRLLAEDGTDLGQLAAAVRDWLPGHRIQRGPDDILEVVRLVDAADGDDVHGYLVVRRI